MKCLDEDSLDLFGNFDSYAGSNLLVTLEKCDPEERDDCKDDAVIDEWLAFKYIVILQNSEKFVPHKFGQSRIEAESYV